MADIEPQDSDVEWQQFLNSRLSLDAAVLRREAEIIARALETAGVA